MLAYEVMLYILIFMLVFHYLLYGLFIKLCSLFYSKNRKLDNNLPEVTILVSALNEEKVINDKIFNVNSVDYPLEKLQVIFVTDGSTDRTAEIVKDHASDNILHIHQSKREGKAMAINRAMEFSKGEVVVLSDANTLMDANAIKMLVRHFSDPRVGGVSGRKQVVYDKARKVSFGDRVYWMYESFIKRAESKLGSIPTADGELFAFRRTLFEPFLKGSINDDQILTLEIVKKGREVLYEESAITRELASREFQEDFNVKSRMVLGGLHVVSQYASVINPFTTWFGLAFFTHKVIRYFMWLILLLILLFSILVFGTNPLATILVPLQLIFYGFALVGYLLQRHGVGLKFLYLPFYFVYVNIAAMVGFSYFVMDKNILDVWKRAER